MYHLGLYPIMERNNDAAVLIMRKEYAQGMEKLEGALRQLQSHLVEVSKRSGGEGYSNAIDSENCSLDEWMLPAMEALHHDDGCGSSGFFVYRKPLVVPPLHIWRARSNDESSRIQNHHTTGVQASLMVAMLFNFGLACHLCYLDNHEGRMKDGSHQISLLQKASQMYDIAIASLRRMAATEPNGQVRVVSANIQFFRAAMNNLAISEQTRYLIAAGAAPASSKNIPSNKGFDRLRELLRRQPPAPNDTHETTLWNCYLTNILRVTNSFQPHYCAAAC